MHLRRWFSGAALIAIFVSISILMVAGGVRKSAFALALARGKIWMSPVWPKERIARTHLLVKFSSPEKGKARLTSLGLASEKPSALPPGWFRVDTEAAAKALGVPLEKRQNKVPLESLKALALALAQNSDVEMVAFDYAVIRVPPKDLLKASKASASERGISPPRLCLRTLFISCNGITRQPRRNGVLMPKPPGM